MSICFVGDGGTLQFRKTDGTGILIPQTVKQIQGINNAIIEIDGVNGIFYDYNIRPTTNDYYVRDLTVSCLNGNAYTYVFNNCINLTNCTGIVHKDGSAFGSCDKLINCTGTMKNNGYGFSECNHIMNCISNCISDGYTNCTGFRSCTELTNCDAVIKTDGLAANGFSACSQLTNCTGSGESNNSGLGCGFNACTELTNCTGYGKGFMGHGFTNCNRLTNCTGAGNGVQGYGFKDCSYINGCSQGTRTTTTGFLGGTNTKVDTLTVMAE